MNAAEYLARVGFAHLLGRDATPVDDYADDEEREAARLADHAIVRERLLSAEPTPSYDDGARWIIPITWPGRVPRLKTWAGRQTLAAIIADHQEAIAASGERDLYRLITFGTGPSGVDSRPCSTALDDGFSRNDLLVKISIWPAVELLAIVGIETLPLISFGGREIGFAHDGRLWRFRSEPRTGYYSRWGNVAPVADLPHWTLGAPPREPVWPTIDPANVDWPALLDLYAAGETLAALAERYALPYSEIAERLSEFVQGGVERWEGIAKRLAAEARKAAKALAAEE